MAKAETIHGIVESMAARWSERTALQMRSSGQLRAYTYADLVERLQAGTDRLKQAGVKAGDRVVLLSENRPEWAIAYLAALKAETTVVPLDPALTRADLAQLLETSDPRAVLLSRQMWEKLTPEDTRKLPVLDIEGGLLPFDGAPAIVNADTPPTPDPESAIASIIFTSGTTGKPKGVLHEHSSLLHSARSCLNAVGYVEGDEPHRVLCVLPLNHIAGLLCDLLAPLIAGATITFVEVVRGDTILAAMQETGTTMLPGVPRLFELFFNEIHRQVEALGLLERVAFHGLRHLSEIIRTLTPWNPAPLFFRSVHKAFGGNLRICCCGAAPLPISVERGLEQLGFTILKAYGLTETGICVCNTLYSRRLGNVGKPFLGVEVRIAGANSSGEGEICMRGATLMRGYFRSRSATSEAIRDGWFHTGDLGRFDSQGNLVITGRIKELIVTAGGKKAAPPSVEQYYQGLPGVKELAVIGIPATAGGGEQIHATVVLDREAIAPDSEQQALQALETAINARATQVPSYLRIQKVHLVEELPKTTTLKVKRAELRHQIAALVNSPHTQKSERSATTPETIDGKGSREQRAGSREIRETQNGVYPAPCSPCSAPFHETEQRVKDIVSEVVSIGRERKVRLDSTLQFDLGIDSLGLIELAGKLEAAFGIKLQQSLHVYHTVADLVKAVRGAVTAPVASSSLQDDLLSEERAESVPPPRGFLSQIALELFGMSRQLLLFEVRGVENVPTESAFILCPNHESHLDIFWIASCLPPALRKDLCCFAKREHFDNPFTRAIARIASAIPTDRDGDVLPALRAGAKALRTHRPLLIHPEGTRTRTGAMLPFRRGAALLAIATGTPLIPVRIVGSYAIFPPHQHLPSFFNWKHFKRRQLQIIFGTPILPPKDQRGLTAEAHLTEQLRKAVDELGASPS